MPAIVEELRWRGSKAKHKLLFEHADGRDLTRLAEYERVGGYASLKKALRWSAGQSSTSCSPRTYAAAAAPASRWAARRASCRSPRKAPKPIYLVANADESEPGTFKDREIMARIPHMFVEGMLIASHAIGASAAFIYIRGEYLAEFEILRDALEEARSAGLVGANVLGSGWSLPIVLHRGAGAYICGEETGLLESLEGKRGQPRTKPPFPAISGLYASPTLINNVETLATVPKILEMGGARYAKLGVENSTGTRVFSLSGNVVRGGNYELELGHEPARAHLRHRRRHPGRARAEGDHPGRLVGAGPDRRPSRHAARLRLDGEGGLDARLGRR